MLNEKNEKKICICVFFFIILHPEIEINCCMRKIFTLLFFMERNGKLFTVTGQVAK